MKWPWQREMDVVKSQAARDIQDAQSEAELARAERLQSAVQRQHVETTISESMKTVKKLRWHLEENGWTALLQDAWGGR